MFHRQKLKIEEVFKDDILNSMNKIYEGTIYGVIGIMNIMGMNYLAVIKEAQVMGKLYGAHIYKITEIKIYPF